MLLNGMGCSTRRNAVGGGGAVLLSDLDAVMASFANGPGFLRDMRMANGLWQTEAAGPVGSTPVVSAGDPVGFYDNQCTITGADGYYLGEANTAVKMQWQGGNGVGPQTNSNVVRADDYSVALSGLAYNELTTCVAIKAVNSTQALDSRVFLGATSYYNIHFLVDGDGTFSVRVYCSQLVGEYTVTPDANGMFVIMTQWMPDNTVEVYCNNSLVGNNAAPGWIAAQQSSLSLNGFVVEDVTSEFLTGWCIIPGTCSSDQRQTFCDYFQQNGGAL